MKTKTQSFHVVCILDELGLNEQTLPTWLELIDRFKPDSRRFWHAGVLAFFQEAKDSARVIEELLAEFRRMREGDKRFSATGIGHAVGLAIVELNWRGRVQGEPVAVGAVVNDACRLAKADQIPATQGPPS